MWNPFKEKQTLKEVDEEIKDYQPPNFSPPTNLDDYEIVKAKDLEIEDIIIHNHQRVQIVKHNFGLGAGSFDFGEYIVIEVVKFGKHIPTTIDSFWSYQECPVIREK